MAERGFFFDEVQYNSDDFSEYFASFITNGVYPENVVNGVPTGLRVKAGAGMKVILPNGKAWINGHCYINDEDKEINIDVADGTLPRIDFIVIRCTPSTKTITGEVVKGKPVSFPTPPGLMRTGETYELGIATIAIPAGSVNVDDRYISDTRADADYCGWVSSTIATDHNHDTLYWKKSNMKTGTTLPGSASEGDVFFLIV